MARKRTSVIWTTSKENFQKLLDNSESAVEIFKKLNLNPYSGNHRTLKQRLDKENFDFKKFNQNKKRRRKEIIKYITKQIPLSDILKKNTNYNRRDLKKRLIKEGLLKYECNACNNKGKWLNKELSLQLDHINGVSNDNRIENLRLLCPNCHSQTPTFSGKRHKQQHFCKCGKEKHKKSSVCQKCHMSTFEKYHVKKFETTKEELNKLINIDKISFIQIGKMFGVSDVAIAKRARKLDIKWPKYRKAL